MPQAAPKSCQCDAYGFPHRSGSGQCKYREPFDPAEHDGLTSSEAEQREWWADMSPAERRGWRRAQAAGVD